MFSAVLPQYISMHLQAYFEVSCADRRALPLDSLIVPVDAEVNIGIIGPAKRMAQAYGLDLLEGNFGFPLDGTVALDGLGILGGGGIWNGVHLKTTLPYQYKVGVEACNNLLSIFPARTKLIALHHGGIPLNGTVALDGKYTLGEINAFG